MILLAVNFYHHSHGRLEISHSFPQGHANKVKGAKNRWAKFSVFSPKPIAAVGCDVLCRCCKNILFLFLFIFSFFFFLCACVKLSKREDMKHFGLLSPPLPHLIALWILVNYRLLCPHPLSCQVFTDWPRCAGGVEDEGDIFPSP